MPAETLPTPQIPQMDPQQFNIYYIILVIVLSYILRIAYIKYIKPKSEPKSELDIDSKSKSLISNAMNIIRLTAYIVALTMGITAMKIAINLPDDATVEVPEKLIFLVTIMTSMLLLFLVSRYD